MATTLFKVIQG